MKLHRPLLSALALSFALPVLVGTAHADGGRRIYFDAGSTGQNYMTWNPRIVVVTSGDDPVDSVGAELESDAGDEELPLVESDAWLHGAATISALPAADADLTVTLYDTGSAALISFSGTLGADGSVTLAADNAKYDIELLAAEVFTAEKGFDLGVDLAGADTYAVAYASITVTEGGAVCLATDEKGNCLKWDTSKEVSTRSELYWDAIGAIWEADATLAHEGLIEVKVKTYDARGEKLATTKSKLGAPWLDDGAGVNTLATDEDPLTRVAFHRGRASYHKARAAYHSLTVVSEGWTGGDDIPVEAEVELTNGKTITIPVNSYQRRLRVERGTEAFAKGDFSASYTLPNSNLTVMSGGVVVAEITDVEIGIPVCSEGLCSTLIEDEDGLFGLAFTVYGAVAEKLPDDLDLEIVVTEGGDGKVVSAESLTVDFDDELTAVFSNEVSFTGDPVGLGLSGKVSLLGEPNRKGTQETLAKGKFYAELSRDGDGDLALSGGDQDEVVSSGDAVVSGAAIGLDDGEGGMDTPPVIVYGVTGNGSGTKTASSQTSARPQLL